MFDFHAGCISVILCLLSLHGCTSNNIENADLTGATRYQYTQLHLGVQVRIVLYAEKRARADSAATAAFSKIATLEDIFSSYRAHSELSRLSDRPAHTPFTVSQELYQVLQSSQRIARETDGAFDVTLGPLISLWRMSREQKKLPSELELNEALEKTGWRLITLNDSTRSVTFLRAPLHLNMGGISKGFILDEALKTLKEQGTPSALIEAGGDIVVGEPPPGQEGWSIDVPGASPDSPIARRASTLHNEAISTSGDTEQFVLIDGKHYSHVIDPRTGLGTTHRTMATVIAAQGLQSDGYATALTVMPASQRDIFLNNHPEITTFIRTVSD